MSTPPQPSTPSLDDGITPVWYLVLLLLESSIATIWVTIILTALLGTLTPRHLGFILAISLTALVLGIFSSVRKNKNCGKASRLAYHVPFVFELANAWTTQVAPPVLLYAGKFSYIGNTGLIISTYLSGGTVCFSAVFHYGIDQLWVNMTEWASRDLEDPDRPGLIVSHVIFRSVRRFCGRGQHRSPDSSLRSSSHEMRNFREIWMHISHIVRISSSHIIIKS